jgi:hypothetical protein
VRKLRTTSALNTTGKVVLTLSVADLAAEQQRSAGHRADFERERERADRMVTIQVRLIAELENLRSLLEAAQQSARPVTPPDVA